MEHRKMRQGELSLFFKFSPKTEKKMKEMVLLFVIYFFCQNSHIANEEEASVYRQIVMRQDSMANKAAWLLINFDKVESMPQKSFVSFTDIHASCKYLHQPLFCLLVFHLAQLCYNGRLVGCTHYPCLTFYYRVVLPLA